jgi:hypothetical protein
MSMQLQARLSDLRVDFVVRVDVAAASQELHSCLAQFVQRIFVLQKAVQLTTKHQEGALEAKRVEL